MFELNILTDDAEIKFAIQLLRGRNDIQVVSGREVKGFGIPTEFHLYISETTALIYALAALIKAVKSSKSESKKKNKARISKVGNDKEVRKLLNELRVLIDVETDPTEEQSDED